MILEGEVGARQTVAFSPHSTLIIADPASFHGRITGFDDSCTLDLGGAEATAATWSSGLLTVDLPSGPVPYRLGGNFNNGFTTESHLGGSTLEARPSSVGSGRGDVHMRTFDGQRYDFQAVG